MILLTRRQIRRYDEVAQERYGIPGIVLMENAGRGAADAIRRIADGLPSGPGGGRPRVGIVCGPGNNGGDGLVVARHLANAGVRVRIYLAAPPDRIRGDAGVNLAIARARRHDNVDCAGEEGQRDLAAPPRGSAGVRGAVRREAPNSPPAQRIARSLLHDAVVVDALFGTGLDRGIAGPIAAIVDAINAAPGVKAALDIPSGLDCDTGRPLGVCVRADRTLTFGEMKVGLALHPGVDLAGEVTVLPIGAPATLGEEVGFEARLLTPCFIASILPVRRRDAHKGTFGHLALVAGTPGKSGAAVLGAEAAVRAGAGLVTVVTTADARPSIEARVREAMVETLLDGAGAPLRREDERRWKKLAAGKTAIAIGPGCGVGPGIAALVERIVRRAAVPVVLDADALNALAGRTDLLRDAPAPRLLTPHPGEMARLAGISTADVQADRIGVARRLAADCGAVVALKGARTVVASPDGRVFVNPTGNPGMASGGSGDVLTGIAGAFLAQGLGAVEAACAAVFIHGAAADRAANGGDGRGLAARDIVRSLPAALRAVSGQWSVVSGQ